MRVPASTASKSKSRKLSSLGQMGAALGIFFLGFQAGLLANNSALAPPHSSSTSRVTVDEPPPRLSVVPSKASQSLRTTAKLSANNNAAAAKPSVMKNMHRQKNTARNHHPTKATSSNRGGGGGDGAISVVEKIPPLMEKKQSRKKIKLQVRKGWKDQFGPFSCNSTTTTTASSASNTIFAWMHIPRTGGSSGFASFMVPLEGCDFATFPSSNYINYGSVHDFNTPGCPLDDDTWGTHCAASEIGHCVRKLNTTTNTDDSHSHSPPRPPPEVKFMTLIRHPVDRVVSEYFWWRKKAEGSIPWTDDMVRLAQSSATLEEWVVHEKNTAHNRQALYFLIDQNFPTDGQCVNFNGDKTIHFIETKYGSMKELNELHLKQALAEGKREGRGGSIDLDDFAFIGILNDDSTVLGFERTFGVKPLLQSKIPLGVNGHGLTRKAKKEQQELVTDSVRKLIEERNKLDMQLYRYVQDRLKMTGQLFAS